MELSGEKVLVTGGAGFIGSHLVESLLRLKARVVAYDCFDGFYPGKEANLAPSQSDPHFQLVRADIGDQEALSAAMKGAKVVFHLAAQAGVRYCMSDPVKAHEVNVRGTLNVLLAARKAGVERVVYASSSSVYGRPTKVPLTEDMPANPTSIYGATKLAGEKYCTSMGESAGTPVVCLRYFSVYGPRGRPDQVVSSFATKVMRGERPVIYGDGSYSRDFTFVTDVVRATVEAGMSKEAVGLVMNVGYGKEITIKEVAKMVLESLSSSLEIELKDGYPGDFPRTLCDNSRARGTLGWRPTVDFKTGLKSELEWLKETKTNTVPSSMASRSS